MQHLVSALILCCTIQYVYSFLLIFNFVIFKPFVDLMNCFTSFLWLLPLSWLGWGEKTRGIVKDINMFNCTEWTRWIHTSCRLVKLATSWWISFV